VASSQRPCTNSGDLASSQRQEGSVSGDWLPPRAGRSLQARRAAPARQPLSLPWPAPAAGRRQRQGLPAPSSRLMPGSLHRRIQIAPARLRRQRHAHQRIAVQGGAIAALEAAARSADGEIRPGHRRRLSVLDLPAGCGRPGSLLRRSTSAPGSSRACTTAARSIERVASAGTGCLPPSACHSPGGQRFERGDLTRGVDLSCFRNGCEWGSPRVICVLSAVVFDAQQGALPLRSRCPPAAAAA